MNFKPAVLAATALCVIGTLAVSPSPAAAQSQDRGSDIVEWGKRLMERLNKKRDEGEKQDDETSFPGNNLFPGDILVLQRSPISAGVEHNMLVRVDEPVTKAGTYRVILREEGTEGRAGIRSNTYLSDQNLREQGAHVVVRVSGPETPGRYLAQVTREDVDDVLSSTPIEVAYDVRPEIRGLPEVARRGERVPVEISGDRYYANSVQFVADRQVGKSMQYDSIITSEGEYLVMPGKRGRYDVVVSYGRATGEEQQALVGQVDVR